MKIRKKHGCRFASILLIVSGVCFAAPDAKKPSPTTQPSEKQLADARALFCWLAGSTPGPTEKQRIEKLIRNLDDNRWKVRAKATEELSGMGLMVLPWVRQAATSRSLEVAYRARGILKILQNRLENLQTELNCAIDTLAAANEKKLLPSLIQLLNHKDFEACYTAEYGLRRITGKCFGYNAYDDLPKRTQAAGRWRRWWKKNRDEFALKQAEPFGILICDDTLSRIIAVTLAGNVVWTRRFSQRPQVAVGLSNGNVIVGYAGGRKNVEEYDHSFNSIWNCEKLDLVGLVCDVRRLPDGNTLIAYTNQNCVSEVTRAGNVVWQKKNLKAPVSAQRLADGNTLITEYGANRVIEVDCTGKIVWKKTNLELPNDATRLPNGNTLIAEFGKKRIIEVNRAGKIVWRYKHLTFGTLSASSASRLPDGTTAINGCYGGAILVDRKGRVIRKLFRNSSRTGKVRMVPAAVLKRKPSAVSSQPSDTTKK